ncbi:MAG: phage tail protein [Deferribacterales bacterium]
MIGSWGSSIIFETSADYIHTFTNLKRDVEAKTKSHSLVNSLDKTQFLGRGLYKITFDMVFKVQMGIVPMQCVDRLHAAFTSGEVNNLRIGKKGFGKFMITNLSDTFDDIMNRGEIASATVSVTLQEYV